MTSETFSIRRDTTDDGCAILALNGRLDARHAESVKDATKQTVSTGVLQLIMDMGEVPFIDSAGLSALVFGLKMARRAGGNVVLAGVSPQILTVFSLTMLDKVFAIYANRQAALDNWKP